MVQIASSRVHGCDEGDEGPEHLDSKDSLCEIADASGTRRGNGGDGLSDLAPPLVVFSMTDEADSGRD